MGKVLVLLALVLVVGCGPSKKEVEEAHAARYSTAEATIIGIAEDVAKETFKIYDEDPMKGVILTTPKWYTPDGQSETGGAGGTVKVEDGSLLVALLIQVGRDGDHVVVTVTPVVERFRLGQSQNDKLAPTDPSLPGWVTGKADGLAVEIYKRAKQYAASP